MATARVLHMSKKTASVSSPSDTLLHQSRASSRIYANERKSLSMYLPQESLNYFRLGRFGRNVGCYVECPICQAKPPHIDDRSSYGYIKWRWLAAHLRVAHV